MCSLTIQLSLLQSLSRPSSSFSPNLEPKLSTSSVSFPLKMKSRICNKSLVLRVKSYGSSNNQPSDSSAEFTPPSGNLPKTRRDILLEYVQNVKPEFMELFVKRAPKHVVDAMRQTVTNMIGTLPPQFFAVTVTSVAENLAQLMMSVLMTGYMFRNAQYRLELQQSLEQVALPEPRNKRADDQDYAPGTQKNVSGEVIRWNNISGPEKIDAKKYIELLEAEIEELNRQELTNTAGEDVAVAMNAFIKRLLAVSDTDPKQMKTNVTETSATDLAKLLYWLMVVGYSIRNIEVRFDMERVLGTNAKLAELPPGEII
ncbi:BnaAnng12920D [Brassica napus]|uniref:BnaAnng12920D protein n=1 Tax=Brassica napus TaxID=3708 RepID=A0A078ISD8_BRANA|nr:BnaAnng12920D [Brassica napus]